MFLFPSLCRHPILVLLPHGIETLLHAPWQAEDLREFPGLQHRRGGEIEGDVRAVGLQEVQYVEETKATLQDLSLSTKGRL